ncbi:hypothetical protein DPX39_090095500 [Trypanosoma brucei equiperdum]|uniref:Uncharacterized protein n=1 Tax=Trypanosoma brucei equiperdum TaxID=630700 RepID=A0A3L6L1M7_9TRYP|nr:hypothetical protein DPX39_090095500 [Trypanosoma brucei equiperdum]
MRSNPLKCAKQSLLVCDDNAVYWLLQTVIVVKEYISLHLRSNELTPGVTPLCCCLPHACARKTWGRGTTVQAAAVALFFFS